MARSSRFVIEFDEKTGKWEGFWNGASFPCFESFERSEVKEYLFREIETRNTSGWFGYV